MGYSERLKLGEVREAFRLLGEVRELGDDPMGWQQHLAERLAGLFRARIVMATEIVVSRFARPIFVGAGQHGWADDRERDYFFGVVLNREPGDYPHMMPYITRLLERGAACRMRRQLTDDRTWYRWLAEVEIPAGTDQDDCLLAGRCLPGIDGQFNVALHRSWGDKPFRESQWRLLHLFIAELARHWEPEPGRIDPLAEMPNRWRQTLARLQAGDSEKEIAVRLGISRHTVHTYVKGLYRHFGVSSRGELLAHCRRLARREDFRPRLMLTADRGLGGTS